ncbi:MAG TPA: helix-hairpin-helix domain-containing protein [Burkholderiaceae bacterium]|nr:helix-hairpin-helix domain-containing protein [Burkholderiaceae bacterium]
MSSAPRAENQDIAQRLREGADLLEAQGANPFRIGAYRKAADTIAALPEDLRAIFEAHGLPGLDAIPNVGPGIAGAIAEMLTSGSWSQLDRLRGTIDAVRLFRTIPGVGTQLAERLHEHLGVDTLEALEVAGHEGRLATVPGVGPRRAAAIRDSLTAMLDRSRRRRRGPVPPPGVEPGVSLLLEVDRRYRDEAAAGKLPTIAPRRFNPQGRAWLPVLHASIDGWHVTALYSNTARAHELDRVFDWVVIYFHRDAQPELQRTVVTEMRGALAGRRVVRGREAECRAWYFSQPEAAR